MKKLILITLASIFFVNNVALAEDKKSLETESKTFSIDGVELPATTPTSPNDNINFSQYQQRKIEYYLFLVDMLTSKINLYNLQIKKKKKDEDVEKIASLEDKLTVTYEALTELYCMPYLYSTLEYKGSPTNSLCLKYLNEIEKRIPDSPIISCVKLGIDDPECATKYDNQYFSTFDIDKLTADDINLKDKVEYDNKKPEINKLTESIKDKQDQYLNLVNLKKTKSTNFLNLRKELRKDYAKLLDLQCNIEITRIAHTKPEDLVKFKVTPKENIADPDFYALLNTIPDKKDKIEKEVPKKEMPRINSAEKEPFLNQNEETQPEATVEKVWRIRLINYDCKNSIDNALSVFDNFPYAVCAYRGKLTPPCIQAWRAYKTQIENERKELRIKNDKESSGFSTF